VKRVGGLFDEIASFANLHAAYRRARRGKGDRRSVQRFARELETELLTLRDELQADTWRPGPFVRFRIHDPKTRTISAAPFRDRVVHQAVMGVLEPCFERWFDHDSHACRKGRGLDAALARAVHHSRRCAWVLRSDIRACFPSMDVTRLAAELRRRFRDRRLLALLERILDHGADTHGRGLPIGNLTSQWLANLQLDALDRHVRQALKPAGYLRYMDDFALFAGEREAARALRDALRTWVPEHLGLELNPRQTQLFEVRRGWPWLGFRVTPAGLALRHGNWRRMRKRLGERHHAWRRGQIDAAGLQQAAASMLAHASRGRSLGLRRATLRPGDA